MKALIFLLLLTACASPSFVSIESTSELSCTYLPIVINGSERPSGCEGIQNNISLYYVLEDRIENYQVVDCLGVGENWEKTIQRSEIVEADGRWGIAQEGIYDGWLQVLVWQGSEDPYVLNLTKEE